MSDITIGKGKLDGKGLYAGRNFKKGELVKRWNLQLISQSEFDNLQKNERKFVHSFYGKLYLFPEPSRYTNHSTNPTVYSDFTKQCDYAARDINKGEPIVVNAKLEVKYELETFVQSHEKSNVTDFIWTKGGYRNAVVQYKLNSNSQKILTLKRIEGNWSIVKM